VIDTVLLVASIVSAFTVIGAFMIKTYKFFSKIEKKYDDMNENLRKNTLYILKLAILSDEMPMIDRIHAGEAYLAMGGNGMVKKKLEKLMLEYEKEQGL
jgi:hypothetical protein